jgi:8-oxo-dGTP pyrophosphatase MutT (NUDIX family)
MPPEATPRPAATILLLRDGADGLEVFMVVRHHAIDFAAGALVFPGGRVEESDHVLAGTLGASAGSFRVAAIRETFEECGVLLARAAGSPDLVDAMTLKRLEGTYRAGLNGATISFDAMLVAESLIPATDLLTHFAHWITPSNQPKRYDTQFFLAQAPAEHLAVHDGHEAVDSIWITPAAALRGAETGRYKLVFATAKNLEKLARHTTVCAAIDAARAATVVTVEPQSTRLDGTKRLLRIPAEAGYGGSEFIVEMLPAS